MPINQLRTQKYIKALEAVESNPELKAKIPRYKHMLSGTLYVSLAAFGVKWSKQAGEWLYKPKEHLALAKADTTIKTRTKARQDKVLMRIITHNAVKDLVISEITELIEALNYSIESVSGGYQNADGDYVRVYINMRRNTAFGDKGD